MLIRSLHQKLWQPLRRPRLQSRSQNQRGSRHPNLHPRQLQRPHRARRQYRRLHQSQLRRHRCRNQFSRHRHRNNQLRRHLSTLEVIRTARISPRRRRRKTISTRKVEARVTMWTILTETMTELLVSRYLERQERRSVGRLSPRCPLFSLKMSPLSLEILCSHWVSLIAVLVLFDLIYMF